MVVAERSPREHGDCGVCALRGAGRPWTERPPRGPRRRTTRPGMRPSRQLGRDKFASQTGRRISLRPDHPTPGAAEPGNGICSRTRAPLQDPRGGGGRLATGWTPRRSRRSATACRPVLISTRRTPAEKGGHPSARREVRASTPAPQGPLGDGPRQLGWVGPALGPLPPTPGRGAGWGPGGSSADRGRRSRSTCRDRRPVRSRTVPRCLRSRLLRADRR